MKLFNLNVIAAASAAVFAFATLPASAGTDTATLNVTAEIESSCTIKATPVEFKKYVPSSTTAHYANGTIEVGCVKGSIPTVALNGGGNSTGAATARAMKHASSADLLPYSLFQPGATAPNTPCTNNETVAWGDDAAQRFSPSGVTLAGSVYNVCGKIDAGHDVEAGNYSDIVTATVHF